MSTRESKNQYFLKIATLVATRATCPRRAVGCVITNQHGHIKATGYNGVPRGFAHCTTTPCGGQDGTSRDGYDSCMATHAEQNALLQCNSSFDIDTIYCTTAPCITCAKLIGNTSCKQVVYSEKHTNHAGISMLRKLGIEVNYERIRN